MHSLLATYSHIKLIQFTGTTCINILKELFRKIRCRFSNTVTRICTWLDMCSILGFVQDDYYTSSRGEDTWMCALQCPTTAGLTISPGWFCGPEPQWRVVTVCTATPQEAGEEDPVGFGKWSKHIWVVHLDTRFDNPGLWSSMYVTWDMVGFIFM